MGGFFYVDRDGDDEEKVRRQMKQQMRTKMHHGYKDRDKEDDEEWGSWKRGYECGWKDRGKESHCYEEDSDEGERMHGRRYY